MCGVVGLIGAPEQSTDAAKAAFLGLTTLQHRGQDGAGILTFDGEGFHHVKNLGLVETVFTQENMETLRGGAAIGHNRYSTIGRGDIADIQPFVLSYPYGIGIVHNGNIVNCEELASELKEKSRRTLLTSSDTEVILNLFADGIARSSKEPLFEAIAESVQSIFEKARGSYSVVALIADQGLVAFRDPNGIRPLVLGRKGEAYMVASESVALTFNGYEIVRDLKPGELLFFSKSGKMFERVLTTNPQKSHCMFEWVYFASPESEIDEVPVYRARIDLGRNLARLVEKKLDEKGIKADLVAPVPDTSRTAATSLAEELKIPYREVLIKNRYIKRTFILNSQDKRKKAVSLKLSPVRSEIEGRNVVLVDDSIVRGTTSRKIIELVRKAGAKKVVFVSTCPPIQHPCYYGIDFPSGEELVAHEKSVDQIESELGADALVYLNNDGLCEALRTPTPCMACLTGKYPSQIGEAGDRFSQLRVSDRKLAKERRMEV